MRNPPCPPPPGVVARHREVPQHDVVVTGAATVSPSRSGVRWATPLFVDQLEHGDLIVTLSPAGTHQLRPRSSRHVFPIPISVPFPIPNGLHLGPRRLPSDAASATTAEDRCATRRAAIPERIGSGEEAPRARSGLTQS